MTLVPACRRALALSVLVALMATMLVALTGFSPAEAASKRERKIVHALQVARNQKGKPYVYGANGPNSFDCSGLTQYSFKKAGLRLPRTSDQQARYARRVKHKSNLRRGDLMFFASGGDVYHMGIFTGRWRDGRRLILHASRSGTPVKVDRLWTSNWFGGTLRRR